MTLMDTYLHLCGMDEVDQQAAEVEQIKEAEVEEATGAVVKMATDYDAAGRRLAHALWGQQKLAGLGFPGKVEDEKEREAEREGSENKPKAKKAPFEGKKDEGEDEEKKRKKEGDGEEQEVAEKKASILARAAEDPEFRAQLLNWHSGS